MKITHSPGKQSGVALVVSLLLLFVMTLVAVSTFSATHIQERSANNLRLQSMAFEAASAGASSAISFFKRQSTWTYVDKSDDGVANVGPQDQSCGGAGHAGWYTADGKPYATGWVDMGAVGGAKLEQRMYCLADTIDISGKRPPRSQLFVHSRGTVLTPDNQNVVAQRDVEVRLDIGVDSGVAGDGCGALCFPGCEYNDGSKKDGGLDVPTSAALTVDGGSGPGITTACDSFTDAFLDAIHEKKGDSYTGGGLATPSIATADPGSPWNDPELTISFRDQLKEAAIAAQNLGGCGVFCYQGGDVTISTKGNDSFGDSDSPQITFVDGDLTLEARGSVTGTGILVVTGDLYWDGTIQWDGLVVILGGDYNISGGGNGGVNGSVVTLNLDEGDPGASPPISPSFGEIGFQVGGGGTADFYYECGVMGIAHSVLINQVPQPTDGTTHASDLWVPECESGVENLFVAGPPEIAIVSWRENIGWREEEFAE